MPPSSLVTYRNKLDDEALKRSQRNSDWSQGPVLAATLGFCQHVFLLGQRYMPSYWSEQFLLPWHTGKGTLVNNVVPTLEGSQSFRHDDSLERSTKLRPQLVGQLVSAMWQSRAQRRVWKGHAMPMTWDQAPMCIHAPTPGKASGHKSDQFVEILKATLQIGAKAKTWGNTGFLIDSVSCMSVVIYLQTRQWKQEDEWARPFPFLRATSSLT